jgi:hypothetical protein
MTATKIFLRNYLTNISSVLVVYLALRSVQLIYSIAYESESSFLQIFRGLALLACFILSYQTHKRNIIAAWAMVLFLALSGISTVLFGIFAVSTQQVVLKIFSIIAGAYFICGGIIILQSIRKGEMRGISSLMKKA